MIMNMRYPRYFIDDSWEFFYLRIKEDGEAKLIDWRTGALIPINAGKCREVLEPELALYISNNTI